LYKYTLSKTVGRALSRIPEQLAMHAGRSSYGCTIRTANAGRRRRADRGHVAVPTVEFLGEAKVDELGGEVLAVGGEETVCQVIGFDVTV
jgi:hypothetical protein